MVGIVYNSPYLELLGESEYSFCYVGFFNTV